jgi:hypothetical protein
LKRKSDNLVASDESEMESSGEESDSRRNTKRLKAKNKHEQRQLALGRKKASSTISINIPNVDSAKTAIEKSVPHSQEPSSEQEIKKPDIKITESEEVKDHEQNRNDQYIATETLDAKKAAPDGMILYSQYLEFLHV